MRTDLDDTLKRWMAKRRTALVLGILRGDTITAEAAHKYGLTVGEIEEWRDLLAKRAGCSSRADADTVNPSHTEPERCPRCQAVMAFCPKPHVGPEHVDRVCPRCDCLQSARLCHIVPEVQLGIAVAPPFVQRVLSEQELQERIKTVRTWLRIQVNENADDELVEHGELDMMRRRHAEVFAQLAETAAPQLWGPDQVAWLARLEHEHDNMRAALAWSQGDGGTVELGARIAAALSWFWVWCGYLNEGSAWVRATLAIERQHTLVRARLLFGLGLFALDTDLRPARLLFEESLSLFRRLGDQQGQAGARN